MCDHEHFNTLRDRVDALEDSVKVYHAKTDEQIKTLFAACKENNDTAKTFLKTLVWTVVLVAVLGMLGLLYGALGDHGFNAVTAAAQGVTALRLYLGSVALGAGVRREGGAAFGRCRVSSAPSSLRSLRVGRRRPALNLNKIQPRIFANRHESSS